MRLILQRVTKASVAVNQQTIAQIAQGLLLFVGVAQGDTKEEADYLAKKVAQLRIFTDDNHKMNLNVQQIHGAILSVSQFTLLANTKRGNRPSFGKAEEPQRAQELYEYFNEQLRHYGLVVETGQFGADMDVSLHNDGPVTIFFDTREEKF